MVKQGVRLVRGGLTGRIYAVTRWKADPDRGPEAWEAIDKFDVTEDFDLLCDDLSTVAQRIDDRAGCGCSVVEADDGSGEQLWTFCEGTPTCHHRQRVMTNDG